MTPPREGFIKPDISALLRARLRESIVESFPGRTDAEIDEITDGLIDIANEAGLKLREQREQDARNPRR